MRRKAATGKIKIKRLREFGGKMQPISAKRKNDAVVTICQNNQKKAVEILELNRAAERLTGYSADKLMQQPLALILPDDVKEQLESYVEFDTTGEADVASVLRKVLHFNIKNHQGKIVPVSMKVFYVLSEDANPRYELLMRDVTLQNHLEELKTRFHASKEKDETTGLASAATIEDGLSLLADAMQQSSIEATFTLMKVDNLDQLTTENDPDSEAHILKEAGKSIIAACRTEDIVGYLGNGLIAAILLDCNTEDAKVVLNRIRMKAESTPITTNAANPDKRTSISISIGFAEIATNSTKDTLVEHCQAALDKAQKEGGNRIVG